MGILINPSGVNVTMDDELPLGGNATETKTVEVDGEKVNVTINEAPMSSVINNLPTQFTPKLYRCVEIDLSVANTNKEIPLAGTIVWAVWGDVGTDYPTTLTADTAAFAFLKLDDTNNDAIPVSAGFQMSGIAFRKLFVSNPIQASKKLVLFISSDGGPLDRIDAAM